MQDIFQFNSDGEIFKEEKHYAEPVNTSEAFTNSDPEDFRFENCTRDNFSYPEEEEYITVEESVALYIEITGTIAKNPETTINGWIRNSIVDCDDEGKLLKSDVVRFSENAIRYVKR